MKVKSESEVAQSCPTLSDPMDCNPPGCSIHGVFQARVWEWGAIAFWNVKVGSQKTPGVTGKFGLGIQNEAGQRVTRVLPKERTGHSKHPFPKIQEMTLYLDITRWSTPKSD